MDGLYVKLKPLREKSGGLNDVPGVYIMKDKSGGVIYIGKAKSLKNRVSGYFRASGSHTGKTRKMLERVFDFDCIVTASEFEALVLECSLIKQHRPKYNIKLKDSRGFCYIKISREDYPRITAEKNKIGAHVSDGALVSDGAHGSDSTHGSYIGPFMSSFAVRETVENANTVFRLPRCSRRFPQEFRKERPCLYFFIKKCAGVCQGKISQSDYNDVIAQAKTYIKSGADDLTGKLERQMQTASENLNFEKAAEIRDRISAMKKISETQKAVISSKSSIDAIASAKTENAVCFVVIQFRGGRLTDKLDYIFEDAEDFETIGKEFYYRYYSNCKDFPRRIYSEEMPHERELLAQLIKKASGHNAVLTVPQKGEGKKLTEMAKSNAVETLANRSLRMSREIKALDELAELLRLAAPPKIIEAYDVSNLGNSGIVGAMVVFYQGKPKKSAYKKFAVKSTESADDYLSVTEMLERRFSRYKSYIDNTGNVDNAGNVGHTGHTGNVGNAEQKENSVKSEDKDGFGTLPDLILIDGGKGQVSAVKSVLQKFGLNIPVFGMVKDKKHRTRAIAGGEKGEIAISGRQAAFNLVTRIQDEVHRFTIAYQRKGRKISGLEQSLLEISGIGEKKARALTERFKTRKALSQAEDAGIAQTAGVSEDKARLIKEHLK